MHLSLLGEGGHQSSWVSYLFKASDQQKEEVPAGPEKKKIQTFGGREQNHTEILPPLKISERSTWHYWDFPDGPVVNTLCFQYRGCRFKLWSGN